jgi:DNA gyrase subunit A
VRLFNVADDEHVVGAARIDESDDEDSGVAAEGAETAETPAAEGEPSGD